jgi:nitroreductase
MEIIEAIKKRRSIRKFSDKKISTQVLQELIEITTLAPSGDNIQPWRLVIIKNENKRKLEKLLQDIEIEDNSYKYTIKSIKSADAIILFYNYKDYLDDNDNLMNIQSIGGAIQTLCLAALSMNLGTLWVTSILLAEKKISSWLGQNGQLVAGVAIGYPDKIPEQRPRKNWKEITRWV